MVSISTTYMCSIYLQASPGPQLDKRQVQPLQGPGPLVRPRLAVDPPQPDP